MTEREIFTATEFDVDFAKLDPEVVDFAYSEGRLQVASTVDSIDKIQEKIATILGWLITAEVSLIGVLVSQLAGDCPELLPLIMNIYGVIVLAIAIVYLVRKTYYKVEIITPGEPPAMILRQDVLECLEVAKTKEKSRYLKAWYLRDLQKAYSFDYKVLGRLAKGYRNTVKILAWTFVFGIILLLALFLFL